MTDRPSPPAEQEARRLTLSRLVPLPDDSESRRYLVDAVQWLLGLLSKAEQERDEAWRMAYENGYAEQVVNRLGQRAEAAEARERKLREALERLIEAASQFAVTAVVGADELMDEDEDKLNIALNDARRALQATQEDA